MAKRDLTTLIKWHEDWAFQMQEAFRLSKRDDQYRHGNQWTREDLDTLRDRNQPPVVINRIASKVNFILGTEVKTRTDPVAKPRTRAHEDASQAATDALRFVADKNNLNRIRGKVASNLFVQGYGGSIQEVEVTGEGKKKRIEIKVRHAPWDRLWFDPHSSESDFSDALYKGLVTWMYPEDVLERYGNKEAGTGVGRAATQKIIDETFASPASHATADATGLQEDKPTRWADTQRKRIKVCEVYYRSAEGCREAHFTRAGFFIKPRLTKYKDENGRPECPLVMRSAYIDDENQRYGIVRNMISPQDEINKRRSKALHLLSVRTVIADHGAVDDQYKAQSELSKPDGWVTKNPGRELQISSSGDFTQGHMALLSEAKNEIDQVGPHAALVGSDTTALSGRAILARQQGGSMELEPLFDELRGYLLDVHRQLWNRVRQFWKQEMWIRVRDDPSRKGFRFVALNKRTTRAKRVAELVEDDVELIDAMRIVGIPDETVDEMEQALEQAQQAGAPEEVIIQTLASSEIMQETITANDVGALDVDIILEEGPDTINIEMEQFEQLAQMRNAGMEIPVKVMFEASQLRNKRELIAMIEAGEEEAAQQQQAATQATVAQLEQQGQLEQAETASKIERDGAASEKDRALAQKHQVEAVAKAGEIQPAIVSQQLS